MSKIYGLLGLNYKKVKKQQKTPINSPPNKKTKIYSGCAWKKINKNSIFEKPYETSHILLPKSHKKTLKIIKIAFYAKKQVLFLGRFIWNIQIIENIKKIYEYSRAEKDEKKRGPYSPEKINKNSTFQLSMWNIYPKKPYFSLKITKNTPFYPKNVKNQ